MKFNIPKNDSRYYWTQHSVRKMLFYGLTGDRVKRIIRNPKRVENGVAENTVAVMQPTAAKNRPTEVWVMYATAKPRSQKSRQGSGQAKVDESKDSKFIIHNSKFIVISAWRYPGISPVGKQIPIPADIMEELQKEGIMLK